MKTGFQFLEAGGEPVHPVYIDNRFVSIQTLPEITIYRMEVLSMDGRGFVRNAKVELTG
jgi:hypothetical protein